MSLNARQCEAAQRLQRMGMTLREIAAEIGSDRESVTLYLFGGITDWTPRIGTPDVTRNHEGPLPGSPGGKGMRVANQRAEAPAARAGQPTPPGGNHAASAPGPIAAGGGEVVAKPVGQAAAPIAAQAPPLWYRPGTSRSGLPALVPPPGREAPSPRPSADPLPGGAREPVDVAAPDASQSGRASKAVAEPASVAERGADRQDSSSPRSAAPVPGSATASGAQLYKLRSADGQFLHENERSLTRHPRFIWRGTAHDYERLFRRRPEWRDLDPVAVLSALPSPSASALPPRPVEGPVPTARVKAEPEAMAVGTGSPDRLGEAQSERGER